MRILLDTNILIDLVADRKPYSSFARQLCIAAYFGDLQPWVSVQSYTDAFYVLTKHSPIEDVKKTLESTLEFFMPCSTYAEDLATGLASKWTELEDYLIAYSSKHIKADYLITRDIDMQKHSPIKAMTAEEFLKMWEEERGLVYQDIDF